ncbi:PKD domain-containing protein [uncultured Methanolobus sp.]|uniref:PKD domain-containing protein n=1 Tax=uncultured Methanolobus sp. TaxID=218300 RepID=UPI0029C83050|nr:PKD domain-containing protein [uncultured Methanolobus sp.]
MLLLCTGTASAATYSGGSGTEGDPYLLSSDSDIDTLSATSADWGSYFQITQDITLVGNHTPIGDGSTLFTGDFDGNGYAVTNLTVYRTTEYAGFFGYTQTTANIYDLTVETSSDGVVSTGFHVGALIGQNQGIVSNCSSTGIVTGSGSSEYVGGLIGSFITSGSVSNCSANVTVTGPSHHVGGLIGACDQPVSNCYATGNVIGGNLYAGGLMGRSWGSVSNCYATGNVTGPRYVGGLIGYKEAGTVSNSFATGTVDGALDSGAFIGLNVATVTNCYYSGTPASGAGTSTSYDNFTSFAFISGGSGLNWNASGDIITTEENTSFIWKIDDGSSLPYFQYQVIFPPVANFTSNVTSGAVSLSVSFTDLTTNSPIGWAWYFGDEDLSGAWSELNGSAGWSGRYAHSTVVLSDGSIVLMGGYDGNYLNDTWRSTDNGTTWIELNSSCGWDVRSYFSTVTLPDDSIVLMGGSNGGAYLNDTWISTDNGATWTELNSSCGWSGRYAFNSVVLSDGSIVLMGGRDSSNYLNDVWMSSDNGITWTEVNPGADWSVRHAQSSIALPDDSIVVIGGYNGAYLDDVWRSTDNGATWTAINSSPGWSAREIHSSVVLPGGSIVMMGGLDGSSLNDMWMSNDNGTTWTEANSSCGWSARYAHSSVVLPDGSIVLMGGNDGSNQNDVWRLNTAGSNEQNSSHTYTSAGTYQVSLQAYNSGGYDSIIQANYITAIFIATSVNASYTSVTYDENDNMTIDPGIVVNGSSTFTSARVYIGEGYVVNEDFLRFTNTTSINGSFSSLTGILSLTGSGSAADYQEAFRNVRYENINENPDISDRNITFVMGSNAVYLESTGHYYESIYNGSTAISWTDAKTAAEARSLTGMQGYLATILTEDESTFLESKAPDNAWIGANDAAVEGEWRWVTGPENITGEGTLFYYSGNSTTLPGFYSNWNSGEPNDAGGTEEYAQILGADNKMWNDLPDVHNVYYYLVEYGGMPNETAPQLTATITVNINSINDAPGMPGNFTNPLASDTVERGSTVNVSWGESTDLENDSLVYDLWYYNGTWAQIADMLNVTNYEFIIPIDDLSEAKFKVYANDSVANSSENNVTFNLTSFVPVANFTADVTSGIVPMTLNFTDHSSNQSTGWLWDFGDGNTSTDQNPTHVYATGGTYNVSLNATNLAGSNVSTQLSYISAYEVPVSNFSANVTEGAAPLSVNFTDLSTNMPTSWSWNFGDGNTSNETNPTHTYVSAGTYNVSLNATNLAGSDISTQTAYISVYITPVANFSADATSGTAPLSVSFTDLSNNTPTSWLWDFGDGSNSTSQNTTHSYTTAGSYNVTLNATNIAGSNVSIHTAYINVNAASTTTSSSSNDGGVRASVSQGQDPEIVVNSASSVKRVTGGSEVNYDFSDSSTPVLGVSFDAKDDKGLVVAKVQVLSSSPEGVPSVSGNSYQMMSIDVGSEGTISSDSADNVKIHFKVSKQWIEDNNIDISTIRMTRYHGEQWNDLPTSQESEDDEYFYFYSETPGFSIFSVVGDEVSDTPVETVETSTAMAEEVEEPVEEETPDTPGFTTLAGIAFVSVAYLVSGKHKFE